ncbi:MAG: phosphate ABC transporter permease subunit PstC [Fimbriimonadaceae bacterium]|nr:phosphate ABC transporter permease subunit PstC [Fimbriimonadaceae bacterium]
MAKASPAPPTRPVDGVPTRLPHERVIRAVCFLCAAISIATTIGIILTLGTQAVEFFTKTKVSLGEFLTGTEWSPNFLDPKFGVLPLVCGTLLITVGACVVAVPLGLLTAIYLAEYAQPQVRRIVKPVLELLAGIPTVVYGYVALIHLTPLLRKVIPDLQIFNALSGSIVVGIMILPLVSSLCEDAISAVPRGLREGGYGLGSTKLEVTMRIVLPSALSGIMAGFILAISRAIGETMAVSLAAGQRPTLTTDYRQSIETMTAYIVQVSKGDTPSGSVESLTVFAVGAALFVVTFSLNILAQWLVRKYRKVYV